MSRKRTANFLQKAVDLLVEYFGIERVRAALGNASGNPEQRPKEKPQSHARKSGQPAVPTVPNLLEQVRQTDEVRYRLLDGFYRDLKDGKVLPESQDIRQFAHIIGLKEINGKSRKDLVPRLMRFLMEQPIDQLRMEIERAAGVSEKERQLGFSVLTDKLLGEK
jgi:hypothetical protein